MEKKEIITITGGLGSGKSSTADLVAQELGYARFSSGDFMRKIALEMKISLNELSILAETDSSIDKKIDEEVRNAGKLERSVIDSRLAYHWIPESFKVYLDLRPEIAQERILKNLEENPLRKQSEDSSTSEEIYQKITSRLESERKRYMDLYGIDHTSLNNFDLVVDTTKNNLLEVVNVIVEEYKKWLVNS